MVNYSVEVDGLRVVRGGRLVLRDVTVAVPAGSVTGLLGPSGGGKTTLLRAVVGVQVVAGGTVRVLGRPAGHRRLRRRVGYSTQNPAVYSDLTVAENLRYFASVLRAGRSEPARVIREVDLTDHADHLAGRLSGGQLSRLSLAVALLGGPSVLVLDEPTVGLDPVLRETLWTMFHRLADNGTTLLVSSHVMDEADRCDQLLFLRDGALLAGGTPDELRDRTETTSLERAFLRLAREREAVA